MTAALAVVSTDTETAAMASFRLEREAREQASLAVEMALNRMAAARASALEVAGLLTLDPIIREELRQVAGSLEVKGQTIQQLIARTHR